MSTLVKYYRKIGGFDGSDNDIRCIMATQNTHNIIYKDGSIKHGTYWTIRRCSLEPRWEEFFPLDRIRAGLDEKLME